MTDEILVTVVVCFAMLCVSLLFVQSNYFSLKEQINKTTACYQEYEQGKDNTWHLSVNYCGDK
jgi:cell division protein FtsL